MNIKVFDLIIFLGIFATSGLFAQTEVPVFGNLRIDNDPATSSITEGCLYFGTRPFYYGEDDQVVYYNLGLHSISGNGGASLGEGSIAFGNLVLATLGYSIAMGNWSTAANHSIVMGNESYSTNYSIALGQRFTFASNNSIAFGEESSANYHSIAIGYNSHSSNSSIVIGYESYASVGSFALGNTSTASANCSVAMGGNVDATAPYSKAMGLYLTSSSYAQTTIGLFGLNLSYTSSVQWVATDPLFVIGNGSDWNNRSNALVMLKNGDTQISGKLKVLTASEGIPMGQFGMQSGN